MIIAGIDPGTSRLGYAVIDGNRHKTRLLAAETLNIPRRDQVADQLVLLARTLSQRLERDKPDGLAVEKLFFAKNTKTALAVAEARGIILLTASRFVRNIWEYTPLEVKMAVTGYGRADKNQVRNMVRSIFPHVELPKGDDAVDAIAIALAALYLNKLP